MGVADKKKGILLDVGVRFAKELNWVGIDSASRPGVDIVHDLERIPYPIESGSVITIKAAHVAEHIPPKMFFKWMDELWRMLKDNGQLVLSAPYAGSIGFWHDPTHVTHLTEVTFQFFDPDFPMYQQYKPKPWNIEHAAWKPYENIEVILRKRAPLDSCVELARESINRGAMQKLSELANLYAMVKKSPPSVVVEIGTARGGVFFGLCELAKDDAKIVSIDLPGGNFGGGYGEEDEKRFRTYGKPGQKLSFLRMDSHKEQTRNALCRNILDVPKGAGWFGPNPKKVDLLFIDGDHTYEGVKKDYEMYAPLVRKGGMIVFHDICHHVNVPTCQVDRFWSEVKKGKRTKEIIDNMDKTWGGIGVILT